MPTKNKKFIIVDSTTRWRIVDPVKFVKTAVDEAGAISKLNGIISGASRDAISSSNLLETVRNTNQILEKIKIQQSDLTIDGEISLQSVAEIEGTIEPITMGREKLTNIIIEEARKNITQFGIELIDIHLRRIAYEAGVEKQVFKRMISERMQIAAKLRAIGEGEATKIMGRMNKELQTIQSMAYKKSQIIRGEAEAQVIDIFANAFQKDPDFYEFMKTLEMYDKIITPSTHLLISTKSKLFTLLKESTLP